METIDRATAHDLAALVDLLGTLFAQEADFQPDRPRQERGVRLILESPHIGTIFTARASTEIVGMVSLLYTVSTATGGPACWVEDLVVRPDRRGEGVGSRLLEHAIDYARAHGFTRITLLTDRGNEGALRFYGKHGFQPSAMTPLRLSLEAKNSMPPVEERAILLDDPERGG